MNLPEKKVDVVGLRGGIDLASTFINIEPGAALDLLNFEPELEGGYRRIAGYERLDGRPAPSSGRYYTMEVDDALGLTPGSVITGATSGATAWLFAIRDNTNILGITDLAGTFELGETVAGTTVTALPILDGLEEVEDADQWQLAAENYYRSQIGAVPGDGPVLGAIWYKANAYAFRADGGAVKLYKTSATGWVEVPPMATLFFDSGVMTEGEITPGTTITGATSSAEGVVKRFIKNAGSYGNDAAGYMVVDVTSGDFDDGENLQVEGVTKAVADGEATTVTLAPGGKLQFILHNFYGGSATRYLYGCDGVNPAFEFDGETLTPIYFPGAEPNPDWNKPKYLIAHKSHLFLSLPGGNMAHSGIGEPLAFSALMGAAQFGLGDECTGFAQRAGDMLAIYTRSMVYGLYGSSAEDWNLQIISETFGAKDYTVQKIGTVYALDDKGIAPLERVDAFGDFESATVSRFVKPILDVHQDRVLGTVVVKDRNQYRLFFNDGTALVMGDDQYIGEGVPAFSTLKLAHIPTCLSSSPDGKGNEVILFGDDDGFVYRMETGYNFDGEPIEYAYRSPFMNQKSPHIRKSYRRLFIDLETDRSVRLDLAYELSYSDYMIPSNPSSEVQIIGGGGYYDIDNWDEIYWDAVTFASRGVPLSGTGRNISVLVYGNSATTRPFTIQTLEVHYLPRRLKRGQ
ncbi:MAG: hypothetical protein WC997_15785 [Porticoccaceae bacterium]